MFCPACGTSNDSGAHFCAHCGAQIPQMAPVYVVPVASANRVQHHLKALGILWIVFGGYTLLMWLLALPFLAGIFGGYGQMGHVLHGMHGFPFGHAFFAEWVPVITAILVVRSALSLLVGFALLTRQRWGRMLAIVAGIVTLLKIPFGTALGIYTLWVLAPAPSGEEYNQMAT